MRSEIDKTVEAEMLNKDIYDISFDPGDMMKLNGFDSAAIGVASRGDGDSCLVYDEELLLELIEEENETDLAGARDHLSFNVLGSCIGPASPLIIRHFIEDETIEEDDDEETEEETEEEQLFPDRINDRIPYLFTRDQVADFFQISLVQLRRLETEYGLGHIKVGKKMKRFSIPDLEKFIKEHRECIFLEDDEIE